MKAKINRHTKIDTLLKANPLVADELVKLNPHFKKLKNVVLRNLLAPRVNISEACTIAGCEVNAFLKRMEDIGFEIEEADYPFKKETQTQLPEIQDVVTLDVRPALAQNHDPLKEIMQAVKKINRGQALRVINTFEPVPLINLLSKKGWKSHVERIEQNEVHTYFYKGDKEPVEEVSSLTNDTSADDFTQKMQEYPAEKLHTIDVRELPMPQPMLTILEALKGVEKDEALFVYHKKVPAFLIPELEERGFSYLFQHIDNNQVNLLIFK